ncbi:HAMP domain-containing sensor histidine kinase [Thermosynechococcaceae cyanobacterium BACA0444]|uniref:histidine kinase n=1 Tax=Pseudocalidococcus azoricus BACA0444 TaxID=2918990 RepID=A0AAE4FT77_9CYAN|nr:HAMP domain-containing sensor histidine kinase [Pseudocalidococcus azoricus]MDS3861873.1 HAMP domain-containing sensor histidine kinase [Pseudocalidococcus azoricus BACA0444]
MALIKRIYWLIGFLFLMIIALEFSTPPPYVFGYLYISVVLLGSTQLSRGETVIITGLSIALTLLNLVVPGLEQINSITLGNRLLVALALVVTGILGRQLQAYKLTLIKQQAQLENQAQLARIRQDFVSTLTHDLKTPLMGAIETLKAMELSHFGPITPPQKNAISIMIRSHETTLTLVQTMLEVYGNDIRGLELQLKPVNLITLIEDVITKLTQLATSRNVYLRLSQRGSEFRSNCWAIADPIQLERVFMNLIANGVKYSQRGGKVEVKIGLKQGYYQISVQDQGLGISPDELPFLFEQFYQGHHHRQAKGTGLGLYLSRQIVTAHGGKLWADPLPTGARFNFTLPAYLGKFPTATLEQPSMKPYD